MFMKPSGKVELLIITQMPPFRTSWLYLVPPFTPQRYELLLKLPSFFAKNYHFSNHPYPTKPQNHHTPPILHDTHDTPLHQSLILLFAWNHSPNSTFRIRDITFISWDKMHVAMEYRLTSILAHIYTYIISIWMKALIQLLLHIQHHLRHSFTFLVSQVEIRCNMAFRNYQRMPRRHWESIIERHTHIRFTDNLDNRIQMAEGAIIHH